MEEVKPRQNRKPITLMVVGTQPPEEDSMGHVDHASSAEAHLALSAYISAGLLLSRVDQMRTPQLHS